MNVFGCLSLQLISTIQEERRRGKYKERIYFIVLVLIYSYNVQGICIIALDICFCLVVVAP